ncbi:MAG TPA: hypothetical protein VJR46_02770 [Candidatus Dormibacteraeota bacterium]|nr:hypothetical protein [Candidatus Dormibacteraeota bacterium]
MGSDRGRYDSAMFWLAFGTAAAVIGLALMTIGVTRSPSGANLLTSRWFDFGLGLLAVGALLLLWALGLYVARRRAGSSQTASQDRDAEAVRGYFAERRKLFDMWERRERERERKK